MNRTLIRIPAGAAAVVLLLATAAAAWVAPKVVLTAQDHGRTVKVRVGQNIQAEITLTGDEQAVVPEFDQRILNSGMVSMKSTSGPQGATVTLAYNLTVRQEGETDLIIPVKGRGKLSKPKPRLKVKIVAAPK